MTNRSYSDLYDHLKTLDKAGLLITVDRPINKDTEMHPLVRWQFRGGIEEKDRKAFLFTNVTDSKGQKYGIPVVVGGLAAKREIYRIGIGCALDEIDARWINAASGPVSPRIVSRAPCHHPKAASKWTKSALALVPSSSRSVAHGRSRIAKRFKPV
jgi:3-polyprenyl-4-hydroxybenzoate decarboxylase